MMTDAQKIAYKERLYLLIEECAEVQHAATKILRHGLWSTNPEEPNSITNFQHLCEEIEDLENVILNMRKLKDIRSGPTFPKKDKRDYLHRQKDWIV